MRELLIKSGVVFDGDFIKLPLWCKRVKLDIGLSECAPHSQVWLEREEDLLVFGFEPLQKNILSIQRGDAKWPIRLNPNLIGKKIHLIEAALSDVSVCEFRNIYETFPDPGCSSLLVPKTFKVNSVSKIAVWSLNHFFKYFPFHKIPVIDYIKTDCQGFDFSILKGCSQYLNRVAIYTLEAENSRYKNSNNHLKDIEKFFFENSFYKYNKFMNFFSKDIIKGVSTSDPTFINIKLLKLIKKNSIIAYQKG